MGIYDKYPVFRIVFCDSWFYKKQNLGASPQLEYWNIGTLE